MFIPKRYGKSKTDSCPFCSRHATTINPQGMPVCAAHKSHLLGDLKCLCGSYLEQRSGKFGTYFNCVKCGNLSMKKVLEINMKPGATAMSPIEPKNQADKSTVKEKRVPAHMESPNESKQRHQIKEKKEITIRSDDPMYFS